MKKGFTLVELLVVIAIISILTIITVSQFQTARRKANDVARKSDLNSLNKALQMYFADYGEFPENINGGEVSSVWCPIDTNCEFSDDTNYIYMKVLPREKNTALDPFCYEVSDDKKSFALFADLENSGDLDCKMNSSNPMYQNRCGTYSYCFTIVSPNIKPGDL